MCCVYIAEWPPIYYTPNRFARTRKQAGAQLRTKYKRHIIDYVIIMYVRVLASSNWSIVEIPAA